MGGHQGNLSRGETRADLGFIKITSSVALKALLYLWVREEGKESKKKAMLVKVRDDSGWTKGAAHYDPVLNVKQNLLTHIKYVCEGKSKVKSNFKVFGLND